MVLTTSDNMQSARNSLARRMQARLEGEVLGAKHFASESHNVFSRTEDVC